MSRGTRSVDDQIEFLTPRESLFPGECPAEFAGIDVDDLAPADDTTARPGWLSGAAALAVVALVAGGVVAAAPWDPTDGTVAPPPTTIVPPETTLATTGLEPVSPVTGFVLDPLPAGFTIRGTWRDNSAPVQHPFPGWGEVWATLDATATGGSWFSVTLLNHRFDAVSQDATRVDLGGRVGLLERARDNTLRHSAPVGRSGSSQVLIVKSMGRSADDLIALFSSIAIEDDRPQLVDDRPTYLDPAQLDGFVKLASQSTDLDLIDAYLGGTPESSTSYANGTGDTYINVDTLPLDPDLEVLGRLAVGPARIFASNGSIPSTFTGDDLVLGASPTGPDGERVARWIDNTTVVVVRTNLPLGQLLDLLPTVRHADARQWRAIERGADDSVSSADVRPVFST